MKIILDLAQSPQSLLTDLTRAVRLALGNNFYIEEGDAITDSGMTVGEIKDAKQLESATAALPALAPVAALPPVVNTQVLPLTPAAPAAVDLDKEGCPYDSSIHSAGKTKISDGTWKKKKGVDPELVIQTNARNKQLLAAPLPATLPPVDAPTVAALPTLPPLVAALPDLPPVAALPDAEIEVTDFPTLAQWIAQQTVKLGGVVTTHVNTGLLHYGLVDATGDPTLPAMAHRPDMVMPFHKWLKTMLGA